MNEYDRQSGQVKQNEREIRRLRLDFDELASGRSVRATSIVGVIPAANRPVEWYFNANLLGLGDELELLEGEGVWISGSFVDGRAYYHIGAYCAPPCGGAGDMSGVDFLLNGDCFCFASALDLIEATGIWISGTCAGGVASYEIGATEPCVAYYGEISIDDNAVGQTLVNADQWYKVTQFDTNGSSSGMTNDAANDKITVLNAGTYELTFVASFSGSASTVYHLAIYINGVIDTSLKIQRDIGTANEVGAVAIAGLAVIGAGQDVEVYVSCDGNNKEYLQGHANLSIRTIGGGAGGDGVDGITGIDFLANDAWFGFGRALDLLEGTGVWISGSMDGDEAEYLIGAYPPDLSPYITGVDLDPYMSGMDFLVNDDPFCFGRALNLEEGAGIWISGSCAGDEARYLIGTYDTAGMTGTGESLFRVMVLYDEDGSGLTAGNGVYASSGTLFHRQLDFSRQPVTYMRVVAYVLDATVGTKGLQITDTDGNELCNVEWTAVLGPTWEVGSWAAVSETADQKIKLYAKTPDGGVVGAWSIFVECRGEVPAVDGPDKLGAILVVIDGAGSVITTGRKAALPVPYDSNVYAWTIVQDDPWTTGGSMVVDFDRYTYDAYPWDGASICGTEKPTLVNAVKNRDLNLTTWATGLDRYDQLEPDVESVSDVIRATVTLYVRRIG